MRLLFFLFMFFCAQGHSFANDDELALVRDDDVLEWSFKRADRALQSWEFLKAGQKDWWWEREGNQHIVQVTSQQCRRLKQHKLWLPTLGALGTYPLKMGVSHNVPEKFHNDIQLAVDTWNSAAGREVLRIVDWQRQGFLMGRRSIAFVKGPLNSSLHYVVEKLGRLFFGENPLTARVTLMGSSVSFSTEKSLSVKGREMEWKTLDTLHKDLLQLEAEGAGLLDVPVHHFFEDVSSSHSKAFLHEAFVLSPASKRYLLFYNVLLHELGHVLGIGHIAASKGGQVMMQGKTAAFKESLSSLEVRLIRCLAQKRHHHDES